MKKYLTLTGLQTFWNKIKATFVAKETGKGLSANDFTDTYKEQLETLVDTGAEVNVLEGVKVGAEELPIAEKKVTLGGMALKDEVAMDNLATALKEIINGKSDAATTLAGYGITDSMTATEINSAISTAIAGVDHMKRKVVNATADIDLSAADANQYIYMVKNASAKSGNLYDEYMVLDGALEKVGDWEVDLSEYAKTADFVEITEEEIAGICI